jgi:hypothetical protein
MKTTLKNFYEWEKWPGIMHNVLFLLILTIIYVFATNDRERTMPNLLMFSIVIGIDIIIHQIMNIRNNKLTSYL